MVVRGGQILYAWAASTAAARSVRGGQVRSEIISQTPKVPLACQPPGPAHGAQRTGMDPVAACAGLFGIAL